MADAPETISTLNGLFKEVYGDDIKELVPNGTKIQQKVKFAPKEKDLGGNYNQPVLLAYAQGFTFSAASGGAFTLNDAKAGVMKNAQLTGSQIVLREQMDYESAARSAKGKNAFVDGTQLMFKSMQASMRKRLEVQLLYGAQGLGTVTSYSNPTITFSTATWAPGIWAGLEGSEVEVMNGGSSRGTAVVSSVDIDARTVTLSADVSGTTSGDIVYYKGAYGNEMTGIRGILNNSGSLFGISASTYSLWKASSQTASSAALNFAKVRAAVSKAVARGLDEDVMLLVSVNTWDDLMNDLAALRRIGDKESKGKMSTYELGAENIKFYSQNGSIEIVPSIYVKAGEAYGLCPATWTRVGAADVTFKTPGYGDQIFFNLASKAGFEVRAYTNQAIFSHAPAKNFIITSIVNSN